MPMLRSHANAAFNSKALGQRLQPFLIHGSQLLAMRNQQESFRPYTRDCGHVRVSFQEFGWLVYPNLKNRSRYRLFLFSTAFTAFTINGAVNPYFSINCSGVPDSA